MGWTWSADEVSIDSLITVGAAWANCDLSTLVPIGTRAVWLHYHNTGGSTYVVGAKSANNTQLTGGNLFTLTHCYMCVPLTPLRVFSCYVSNAAVLVSLVGYTNQGVWSRGTTYQDLSLATTGSYVPINLIDYVPENNFYAYLHQQNASAGSYYSYGTRSIGSTQDSTIYGQQVTASRTSCVVKLDANYDFEQKIDNANSDTYLIGSESGGITYVDTDVQLTPAGWNDWYDIDLSAYTGATAAILLLHNTNGSVAHKCIARPIGGVDLSAYGYLRGAVIATAVVPIIGGKIQLFMMDSEAKCYLRGYYTAYTETPPTKVRVAPYGDPFGQEAGETAVPYNCFMPYDPTKLHTATTANWGADSADVSREWLTYGNRYRIRQNGSLSRIRMYFGAKTAINAFYIKVWRYDGSAYDLVGTSENIIALVADSKLQTIDFVNAITVQEGDYLGYRIEKDAGTAVTPFYAGTGTANSGNSFYVNDTTPSATNYNWAAQTSSASVCPIECYMIPPMFVSIGNSIMGGVPGHYSMLQFTSSNFSPANTIVGGVASGRGTYQNMGHGGQQTTSLRQRFVRDVVELQPSYLIIEGGVNDISQVAESVFLANWQGMLNLAQPCTSITHIVVLLMTPWTAGDNTQLTARDTWNTDLITLAGNGNYPKITVVNAQVKVGVARVGGTPTPPSPNYWDIIPAYDSAGVHFTGPGYLKIAEAITETMFPVVPTSGHRLNIEIGIEL